MPPVDALGTQGGVGAPGFGLSLAGQRALASDAARRPGPRLHRSVRWVRLGEQCRPASGWRRGRT